MSLRIILISVILAASAACGPGRQAAWEKESAAKQAAGAGDIAALAQQADEAWQARNDRASLEKAISIWETIVAQDAKNADALTKLSRAYYMLGDGYMRLANEEEQMLATFEKGVSAGERAMLASSPEFEARVKAGEKVEEAVKLIPPSGQAAIYWYAVNLGKFGVAKGFTTVLYYKDRIYSVMQHVLAIDENFFYGAPHRYFGAFYAKAPSFAGGDMEKSKQHFDKALKIEPNYLGTKVLYAEFYAPKKEDKELFTRLLNEVKAGDANSLPDVIPEQELEQKKADQLLKKTDEIF